jgi:hypothetical protein
MINVRLVIINAIVPSYRQFLEGFFEADTVVAPYSPARRRSPDIDDDSRRKGWNDLVASIEERHALGSGTTNRIPEGDHLDPAILAIVQNITRQPTDDYAIWRVRCKVIPLSFFSIAHL